MDVDSFGKLRVSVGPAVCSLAGMAGWKDFREIAAWQYSERVKVRIYELLERPEIKRDFRFSTQLRSSASSAPANIAEGFGRFGNREFARFSRIAKGSLQESLNHLIDARDRQFIADDELFIEEHHIKKAIHAVTGLIRHLETSREPEPKPEPEPNRTKPGTRNP